MGSAFKSSIDTSSVFGKASKSAEALANVIKQFGSGGGSFKALGQTTEAVDKLGAAFTKLPLQNVSNKMSILGKGGRGAFTALTAAVKVFGLALRSALAPLRLVFFVLELIKKANPFRLLSSALEKLQGNAEGSTSHINSAKDLKTTEAKLRAFNRAEEIHKIGYTTDAVGQWRAAITDPEKMGDLAQATGFSAAEMDKLRTGDAIDGYLKSMTAFFKQVDKLGGRDALASNAVLANAASSFGIDYNKYYSQRSAHSEFMKDFNRNKATDEGGDASRSNFEKAMTRIAQAFDKLISKLLEPFMKLMTPFINWLSEFIERLSLALGALFDGKFSRAAAYLSGEDPDETTEQKRAREARERRNKTNLDSSFYNTGIFREATSGYTAEQRAKLGNAVKKALAQDKFESYKSGKYEVSREFKQVASGEFKLVVEAKNVKTGNKELLISDTFKVE